jgi:hypothetical protein
VGNQDKHPTAKIPRSELVGAWPEALTALEKLGPWATHAFRLGILRMIEDTSWKMRNENYDPALVVELRELIEALAHLPCDHPLEPPI